MENTMALLGQRGRYSDEPKLMITGSTSCPGCRATVRVPKDMMIGDARCPNCNRMLWYVQPQAWVFHPDATEAIPDTQFFDAVETSGLKQRAIQIVAEHFGCDSDRLLQSGTITNDIYADVAAGDLDDIELLIELERELHFLA